MTDETTERDTTTDTDRDARGRGVHHDDHDDDR